MIPRWSLVSEIVDQTQGVRELTITEYRMCQSELVLETFTD